MLPPCFQVGDRLFPLVRQRAAVRMDESGLTQAEIGKRLGVSQAMVSKYLRGGDAAGPETWQAWVVDAMAEELASATPQLAHEGPVNPWCRTLENLVQPHDDTERRLFEEVLSFVVRLDPEILAPLVPAVSVNVAGALPEAKDRGGVLAFPGRLALVGGRLRAHGPPEFGASRHLASLLLTARATDPKVRFVVNLKGGDATRRALRRAEEVFVEADAERRNDFGVPAFDLGGARAIVDPGGLHIEPALYLLDADVERLAERVDRIARAFA